MRTPSGREIRIGGVSALVEKIREGKPDALTISNKIKALDDDLERLKIDGEGRATVLEKLNTKLSDFKKKKRFLARQEVIEQKSRELWMAESRVSNFPFLIGVIFFISLLGAAQTQHGIPLILSILCGLYYLFWRIESANRSTNLKQLRTERDRLIEKQEMQIAPLEREIENQQLKNDEFQKHVEDKLKEKKFERRAWRRLQIEIEDQEREARRRDRRERVKGQADAYRKDIRKQSKTIKKRLEVTQECPYCRGMLGDDYHADHIYPASKGGLSTTKNMINVCQSCNFKKADLTLRQFIEKYSLDESEVTQRLHILGKEC